MADPRFPDSIKPVINQGYDFGMPNNVLEQPVAGGSPLLILDTKYGYVDFNVVIVGNPLKMQVWNDFYYGKINSGSAKFVMVLDSGNGLEDHVCQILPQSVNQSESNDPTRIISYVVRAERTPFQDNPYEGALVDLYEEFGDNLPAILDRLAIFVNIDMPDWIEA